MKARFVMAAMAAAFVAVPLSSADGAQSPAPTQTTSWWDRYIDNARLVRLPDGRKIELYCEGAGAPLVLLDAGAGVGAWGWRGVQDAIAAKTRVCAFSRAGLGRSTARSGPGDTASIVADTEAMLKAARLKPPYVLVGESMASFDVRLYAFRHPDQVAGIVLVDPGYDWQYRVLAGAVPRLPALVDAMIEGSAECEVAPRPAASTARCAPALPEAASPRAQSYYAGLFGPTFYRTQRAEMRALEAGDNEQLVAARRQLGAMPIIVLTAERKAGHGLTAEEGAKVSQAEAAMQGEIATLSTRGQRRTIEGSAHHIQHSQPQALVAAVTEVIGMAGR